MRRIKYLLIIIAFALIGMLNVKAIDTTEKVYDFANVLTPTEKEELKQDIDAFIEKYDMDMLIVTVKYHNYSSTMEYADNFYDLNNFGLHDTEDGLVCVIDFSPSLYNKLGFWISTKGQGIIMYDDARINKILDEMDRAFYKNEDDYYEMFDAFIKQSSYYASKGIPASNKNVKLDKYGKPYYERPFPWFGISVISLIVSTVTVLILIKRNKMVHKSTNADLYIDKESTNITDRRDQFLTTATTRVRISSSSSGGGRVGGSSFHSSGGGFHGGGGRGH